MKCLSFKVWKLFFKKCATWEWNHLITAFALSSSKQCSTSDCFMFLRRWLILVSNLGYKVIFKYFPMELLQKFLVISSSVCLSIIMIEHHNEVRVPDAYLAKFENFFKKSATWEWNHSITASALSLSKQYSTNDCFMCLRRWLILVWNLGYKVIFNPNGTALKVLGYI